MKLYRILRLTLGGLLSVTACWFAIDAVSRFSELTGKTMEPKPFEKLAQPRKIDHIDLPEDLANFYARHEGSGYDTYSDSGVRFAKLSEVEFVESSDIYVLEHGVPGWENFEGILIGASSYFDSVVYVLSAPVCKTGSIILFGTDVYGPGGEGPDYCYQSLVISPNFQSWLTRLESNGWVEYGMFPGNISELSEGERTKQTEFYRNLNPLMEWE